MATIKNVDTNPIRGVAQFLWEAVTEADVGAATKCAQYSDKTVQVVGTFGGSTLTMQGSNDGTNWFTLTDPAGANVAFTVTGAKLIAENPLYIRPSCTGGASTDLDVYVIGKA